MPAQTHERSRHWPSATARAWPPAAEGPPLVSAPNEPSAASPIGRGVVQLIVVKESRLLSRREFATLQTNIVGTLDLLFGHRNLQAIWPDRHSDRGCPRSRRTLSG